jgi:5-oxoprolinase (ATP-hydrolysing) subunit A
VALSLDLNADVGEGFPHDAALLRIVTSANVACGFHAGDTRTMRWVCQRCADRGVAVGAQVSYRDWAGFGRRDMDVGYDDLLADVREQCHALGDAAAAAGVVVAYLKPHGALYNRVVWDQEQARAVVDGADGLAVLGLPGSVLLDQAAAAGLRGFREFFADRGYRSDGRLVPRSEPGAVVMSVDAVAGRVRRLVDTGAVAAVDGTSVHVAADSICVHGDTEGAVKLARAVAATLRAGSVTLRRFA